MQVENNSVVSFDYTLTDNEGQVIDTSDGHEPLVYLHGKGGIIPGLERELAGKSVGDDLQVSVTPADGYGEQNEALKQEVPRAQFEGVDELEVGMQFRVNTETGPMVINIIEVGDEIVKVDGNHPLAGVHLNFAVTIREIRAATSEEIEHGHAHGPGGHHH
jgi:FKBP-type peptidyl-prolyl cis-trans isomerase SlyD